MFSPASFYLLPKLELPKLKERTKTFSSRIESSRDFIPSQDTKATEKGGAESYGEFWDFLQESAESPYEFQHSGEIILGILAYFQYIGTDLTSTRFDTGVDSFAWLILATKERQAFLERLQSSNIMPTEVEEWSDEFFGHLSAEAIGEGIEILCHYLEKVNDETVLLFHTRDLHLLLSQGPGASEDQNARRYLYMCDRCGQKFEDRQTARRIGPALSDVPQICGTSYAIFSKNGVEYIVDATVRNEHSCREEASGYFEYLF